jgi:PAS domain S-box-containing protein
MGALATMMRDGVVQFRLPDSEDGRLPACEVLQTNTAFEKLTGLTMEQIQGRRLADAMELSRVDRDAVERALLMLHAGERREHEVTCWSSGRWLAISLYRFDDDLFAAILRDTTEERERSESLEALVLERTRELELANAELVESSKVKNVFLASMSHELRTPLNSIIGFTGVLLGGAAGALNEEQDRQLRMVNQSGKQLLALVNDILDLSKIDAGAVAVDLTETDVNRLCAEALEFIRHEADRKGLSLRCEPCSAADESCPSAMLDRGKVQQVLLNLLSNAVKYTDTGEVRLTVHRPAGGSVRMTVADSGRGIAEKDIERIFEEFEQVLAADESKPPGTGLGLAISRRLAQQMGGDISVTSVPGAGSAFTLELPFR